MTESEALCECGRTKSRHGGASGIAFDEWGDTLCQQYRPAHPKPASFGGFDRYTTAQTVGMCAVFDGALFMQLIQQGVSPLKAYDFLFNRPAVNKDLWDQLELAGVAVESMFEYAQGDQQ